MAGRSLFRGVTIIGVGLIGGSLGLAIKRRHLAREVIGFSRRHATLQQAIKAKVIDKALEDIKKAVAGADLVIMATPVKTIIGLLGQISRYLKRGCIVIDVGSTKAAVVEAASKILPPFVSFVGSHPLAGSEKKGVLYSDGELFQNTVCLITPTEKTNKTSREKIKFFWTKLGATVKFVSPQDHDRCLAYTSHMPHLLGYALMGCVSDENLGFVTPSFKEMTRIASSSPELWTEICLTNSHNILLALDDMAQKLSSYRKAIISQDTKSLEANLAYSKTKRDGIR